MNLRLATAVVPAEQDDPRPVFSRRIGFSVGDGGLMLIGPTRVREHRSLAWPGAKLTLFRDHLSLSSRRREYRLGYADIERIVTKNAFLVRIRHHSRFVPRSVLVHGWRLPRVLRDAIERFNLPLV